MQTRIIEIKTFLESKGFTEKTVKTYCYILSKVFSKLGTSFNEADVESYLTSANLQPRAYNLYRAVINFYAKQYLGFYLRFSKAKVPKSLPTYVTKEEINNIVHNTPNIKHKLGLALLYTSGLRSHELCRLKKQDFDFDNFIITIREGKGKKDRQTIINPRIINILENYVKSVKDSDYIFPTYNGHICERSFQEVLKRGISRSKITKEIGLHDLRHSFAINLVNAGIDIEEVRKMLGHSSLKTTQIYLQMKTCNLKQIALRLEGDIVK